LVSALRLIDLGDVVQNNRDHDIGLPMRFFEDVQCAAVNIKRLRLSQLTMTKVAELHARQCRVEIVGAQGTFVDGDRARNIPLGVVQSVLAERDLAKRGKDGGNVGMIWAEGLFADGKGSSQRRFGLGHFALGLQGLSKNNKGCCRQW